ncbi:hypothetical protein FOZ60_010867 [Perkinsus olseni]|uniref:Hexose transporter 1 n=1 Tax=Perkinsus olseni TaxID=32597 RepID=A0A7J6PBD8_PEROL|nr:hypothetical protein FOZ60_010867 [Perkinsus olseni]
MTMGIGLGFTGPTIDTMRNTVEDTDGEGTIDIGSNSDLFVFSSTTISSLFSAALVLGAFIGSLMGGPLGELTGRRLALLIASPMSSIAYLAIALSSSPAVLIIARFVAGLSLGLASFVAPVYIGEVSPTRIRGRLGALFQLFIAGGMLYVYAMGLAFRTDAESTDPRATSSTFCQWRRVAYISMIPSLLLFLAMYMAYPSPRWLATKGRIEEAKRALCRLRGLPTSSRTEEILALERVAEGQTEPRGVVEKFKVIMECKTQAVIAVMIHFLTQLSGLNALAFYLTSIFMKAGLSNADLMSLIVQLVTMFTTLPASYLVETLGRRVLLLSGCLIMGVAQFLSALFFYLDRDSGSSSSSMGWLVLLGVWILVAELFPCRARGVAASLAASANWISAFIFILALDPLVEATSLYVTFWSFAVASWALVIFVWFMVPETKGKTFEEIQEHFKTRQTSLERCHHRPVIYAFIMYYRYQGCDDIVAILCVIGSLLAPFVAGIGLGFTSPTIDTMRNTVLTTRGQPVDIGLDSDLYVFKDQDFVASAFSAALTAGACLGALIAGPVADQIGRRLALMLNSPLGIMAYLTIGLSSNVYLLIAVASVYISEVAPTRLRGHPRSVTDGGSSDPLASDDTFCDWRLTSFVCIAPCALLAIAMYFALESPRWLACKRHMVEAQNVLCQLRGCRSAGDPRIASEMPELTNADHGTRFVVRLRELLSCRKQLLVAIVIQALTQLSGLDVIAFYLVTIFQDAHLSSPDLMAVTVQLATAIAIIPACLLVERSGRRPLLLLSSIVMCLNLALIGAFFYVGKESLAWLSVVGAYGYNLGYAFGVGPIRWLLVAEIFPDRCRSLAAGLATMASWLTLFIIILVVDRATEATSRQALFWFFAAISAVITGFVWLAVPETKGRSFEEIKRLFYPIPNSVV